MEIYDFKPFQLMYVYMIILTIILLIKKKEIYRYWMIYLFGLYLLYTISFSFFPIPINVNKIDNHNSLYIQPNNYIPFRTFYSVWYNSAKVEELIFSILQFISCSFLLCFLLKEKAYKRKTAVKWTIIIEICIEILQFLIGAIIKINYKSINIDTVFCSFIGGILGVVFADGILFIRRKSIEWYFSYMKERYNEK